MFDFDAVARMDKELGSYAKNQQKWIASGQLGDDQWKAEKRLKKAAKARRALRAFLHSSEIGESALKRHG